ncbi:antichymotrypsin-1 [Bicyclus anynana]|uniref:Antichymotrypsin-1 n=1 Tax=Bicyclus anynana TaxID=110368 RepID=A0ABM3LXP0_BICAN|nr:antichymotrypsin-1 [Bicyclus anynana]
MATRTLLLLVSMVGVVHPHYFPYTRTDTGDSVDIASMKLLKETYNAAEEKNVVASPLGVLILLSLYGSGTEGENREELVRYLRIRDFRELELRYARLSYRFGSMDHSFLTLCNKVLVSDKYKLEQHFLNTARSYLSEVDNINFEDPQTAADSINEWSARKTDGKISKPVSASDIDARAAVALLNVIYFQGHWHVPFNASNTKEQEFHVDRSTSELKPMMHLEQPLIYRDSPELGARLVELPYKESQFRMIIILPKEIDGLQSVLDKVAQKGLLEDVFKMNFANTEVILDLPKFEIRSKLNLNELLPKVGVSRIFNEPAPGLVSDTKLIVSRALQQAFITVDEEGASAGAFTGVVGVPVSADSRPPPPIHFKADHPFLFAILHDDVVLFAGTYSH